MKCGEERPFCRRCIDSNRECRGYDDDRLSRPQPVLFNKKLLPKSTLSSGLAPAPAKIALSPTPGIRFQQEREYRYFRLFQDKLALEFSSGFETTLWNQLVLQAADSRPIFQLTVATGALRQASLMPQAKELDGKVSHRQHALQQYSLALKGVQKMLSQDKDSLRTALISSLLIFCFENMLGDTERAVRNIQSALGVIHKILCDANNASPYFQQNHVSIGIEEEIIHAFMRLDRPAVALLGRIDKNSAPVTNRRFGSTFYSKSYTISSKFTSIAEARKIVESIRYRVLPKYTPGIELRRSFTPPESTPGPVAFLLKSFSTAATYDNCDELLAEIEAWHRAFEGLYAYAMTPAGADRYIAAETLYAQALALSLLLRGFGTSPSESPKYDPSKSPRPNFYLLQRTSTTFAHPSFQAAQKILSIARKLVKHPAFVKGFVFDAGIIPSLWIIVMLCPDREFKMEATQILRSMDGRVECVWDSATVAETGEKALALVEEMGNPR